MTDFIYDKSKGTLIGHGQTWHVKSGTNKIFNPIVNGTYTAPTGALMTGKPGFGVPFDNKYNIAPFSYRDKKAFSWFLWLGKENLGIHPDGNVPGTKGCIGITDNDTKKLFDLFKELNKKPITVLVK